MSFQCSTNRPAAVAAEGTTLDPVPLLHACTIRPKLLPIAATSRPSSLSLHSARWYAFYCHRTTNNFTVVCGTPGRRSCVACPFITHKGPINRIVVTFITHFPRILCPSAQWGLSLTPLFSYPTTTAKRKTAEIMHPFPSSLHRLRVSCRCRCCCCYCRSSM